MLIGDEDLKTMIIEIPAEKYFTLRLPRKAKKICNFEKDGSAYLAFVYEIDDEIISRNFCLVEEGVSFAGNLNNIIAWGIISLETYEGFLFEIPENPSV